MIDPTDDDIGLPVVYLSHESREAGVVTGFNDRWVFVRYGTDLHSKATPRGDLEWVTTEAQ